MRAGKIRYLGASSGAVLEDGARAVARRSGDGWARFISMQNHYNLLYREEEREMIPLCLHEGVGLVPWSPLARGVALAAEARRRRPFAHEQTARSASDTYSPRLYDHPGDWDVVDAVEKVARERGATMAEVALAWLLSRPGVVAPIVGATKLDHLNSALRALELRLSPEEIAALESPYKPHAVKGHT